VTLSALHLGHLLQSYTRATLPTATGALGLARVTDEADNLVLDTGTAWVSVTKITTQGDLVYGAASGVPTRLAIGVTDQVLGVSSGLPAWVARPRVLDTETTTANVVSALSGTLYTVTIPGNTLGAANALRLTVIGDYLNDTTAAEALTVVIAYGGTNLFASGDLDLSPSSVRRALSLTCDLFAKTSGIGADQQNTRTELILAGNSGNTAAYLPLYHLVNVNTLTLVDQASDQTLSVTVTHSVSSASVSVRALNVRLELLA